MELEEKMAREILERETCPQFVATPFFLEVFFRVTHDGLSERGTSRSLITFDLHAVIGHLLQADDVTRNLFMFPATSTLTTFLPSI